MKILTICPSIRKKEAVEMFKSFRETTIDSDIIFLHKEGSITKLINECFEHNKHYDYYHITNDDCIYQTIGWDVSLAEKLIQKGGGIAYGNDLLGGVNLPTFPFISGKIARALGWLQLPPLDHLCGDMVWKAIGSGLNRLYYCPEVVIEHRHFLNKKAPKTNYEITNSSEMYNKDNATFRDWVHTQYKYDLDRINAQLEM